MRAVERLRNGGVPRNPVFLMPATHGTSSFFQSFLSKERKKTGDAKRGMGGGQGPHLHEQDLGTKRKKENSKGKEGCEDGTPPPHRDFKERGGFWEINK
jgi:hypothetical protein